MIGEWLKLTETDSATYSFSFIKFTNKKKADSPIIDYLKENILYTYEDKSSLDNSLADGSPEFIRDYLKSLFPNDENADGEKNKVRMQAGDFAEITTKLLLKHFYNKESLNKLKYKLHAGRSVFGTDLIAFDNINSPQNISFCEVKSKKSLKIGKIDPSEKEEDLYISVKAHNSLKYDTEQKINPVLRFMMNRAYEAQNFEQFKMLREILNGKKIVNKAYEIFILTEDSKNSIKPLMDALEKIDDKLNPLFLTIILVDDLTYIRNEVWGGIEKYAFSLYGVDDD